KTSSRNGFGHRRMLVFPGRIWHVKVGQHCCPNFAVRSGTIREGRQAPYRFEGAALISAADAQDAPVTASGNMWPHGNRCRNRMRGNTMRARGERAVEKGIGVHRH